MKQRILAEARQEIYKSGFRFTMADMAKRCGLSTKTIYQVYSSKEELILDMVRLAIDELAQSEHSIVSDPKLGTMDKLRALLVLFPRDFQFFDIKRLHELQRYYPNVWSIVDSFLTEQWDGVTQMLAAAQAEGLLEDFNKALFIQLYIGGLYRLMEQSSAGGISITLRQALDEMVDIMLDGIRKR